MKSSSKEQGSFSSIKLGDILSAKEISDLKSLYTKNKLKEARQYLNEPERKKRLDEKGVFADYLYYVLELQFRK